MTAIQLYREFLSRLEPIYGPGEHEAITRIVWEDIAGISRSQLISNRDEALSGEQLANLSGALQQLLQNRPVQYVTGKAMFCGRIFLVSEGVLIPRPETEELTEWAIRELTAFKSPSVIDIGTGSGCIAITISLDCPQASVLAIDASEAALRKACENAATLAADLTCSQVDFLDQSQRNQLGLFDCVVSNPPYIPVQEKQSMSEHVTRFEPELALFVRDEEPLIFYQAIADFCTHHLTETGMAFMEIHENLGQEVCSLFGQQGFETELRKDMFGKDRMVKATRFR